MAEWSSTTQVLTEEQRFYQKYGFVANMRTMDYLWRDITRLQKQLDSLDHQVNLSEVSNVKWHIYKNLQIYKALYPILKKQHDANRIVRSALQPSTYEIYYYGRERTVCDPT